jgi:hypothetical protein
MFLNPATSSADPDIQGTLGWVADPLAKPARCREACSVAWPAHGARPARCKTSQLACTSRSVARTHFSRVRPTRAREAARVEKRGRRPGVGAIFLAR